MRNYSRGPKIINPNAYRNGRVGILVQDEYEYLVQLYSIQNHLRAIIDEILPDDETLSFPIGTEYLQARLSGFTIDYKPFSKGNAKDLEGFRLTDPFDESKVTVFYNTESSKYRQRYTQIHETLHICQLYDVALMIKIDELMANPAFPTEVVKHMLERATDKAVAMYMMPERFFKKKYVENPSVKFLSDFFETSIESVKIRQQECKLPFIS